MKRAVLLGLSLALILSLWCGFATAEDGISWSLNNGVLTISGTEMPDYDYGTVPWWEQRETITSVVIQGGMNNIGRLAFYGCYNMANIIIPGSVSSIGQEAFRECEKLTSIVIPEGVVNIGSSAFQSCYKLNQIIIPEGVVSIGNHAFDYCSELSSVSFPTTLTSIGNYVFLSCQELTDITVADGNSVYCSVNGILYNKDKTTILLCPPGKQGTVTIPEGVENIGVRSFSDCIHVNNIIIPSSVRSIASEAFSWSGLTNITIPDGVTSIGYRAFYQCSSLQDLVIPSSVTSLGNQVFGNSGLTSFTIPENITSIPRAAFYDCFSLTEITIPISVTSIAQEAFSGGVNLEKVYYEGTPEQWNQITIDSSNGTLTSATILYRCNEVFSGNCGAEGDNLTWELARGKLTISGTGAMPDFGEEGRPWEAYSEEITSVVIQNGVTNIGNRAFFDMWRLETISLPDSLVSVGTGAFQYSGLKSVRIPKNVTAIGEFAFVECSKLTAFEIAEQNSAFSVRDGVLFSKDQKTLICCPAGKTGSFFIPESVTTIGTGAFVECHNLWIGIIPDSVNSIGNVAFRGCGGLANNLTLPSGLTVLNLAVFKDCGFEAVEIPEGVQTIGRMTFNGCLNLRTVIIPVSVTEIQEFAFESCDALETVYYAGTSEQWNAIVKGDGNDVLTSVNIIFSANSGICGAEGNNLTWELSGGTLTISGTGAMQNYSYTDPAPWNERSFTSVVLNEGVASVGNNAFRDNYNLKSVILPDSLTSIGSYAFISCSALKSILIPKNVTSIAAYAFGNNYSLSTVEVAEQNSAFTAVENVLYSKDQTTLIFCSPTKKGIFRIPKTVSVIYAGAFLFCDQLTEIIIPENVSQINQSTFSNCFNLKAIQIPQSVLTVLNGAFSGCENLQYIYYQGNADQWNAMTIGEYNDELTQANRMYEVYDLNRNITWNLENGVLTVFGEDLSLPVPWNDVKDQVQSVILQEGVTTIVNSIFEDHHNLLRVSIPSSVTSIGGYVFSDCENLTEIKVASGNTTYSDNNGVLLGWDGAGLIQYPAGKTDSTYTIPNTVTWLYPGWFYEIREDWGEFNITGGGIFRNAKHLTSVMIPNGVTNIPSSTFYGCENLNSITIPASVTEIGGYAFSECGRLGTVHFTGTKAQWKEVTVANGNDVILSATVQCSDGLLSPFGWSLENGVLTISGNEMPDYSYEYNNSYESPWYSERANIVSVVLADGVERIGNNAFYDCFSVSSVNIPDSVRSIGDMAFYSCTSLTNVTIPQSVLTIGYSAFNYCTSLTSVMIPASVTEIGAYAFADCTSLTEIRVAQGNTTYSDIDGVLFGENGTVLIQYPAGNTRMSYDIPNGVTTLVPGWGVSGEGWLATGGGVFRSAKYLRKVTIPASVKTIPDSTFYDFNGLISVTIPVSVTEIGKFAFHGGDLYVIHYGGSPEQWEAITIGEGNNALASTTIIYNKQATPVDLSLPAALTTIESEAFAGLPDGIKVYIPAMVTEIADDAFGDTTVVIFAEPSSTAEDFAWDHGYSCVVVED